MLKVLVMSMLLIQPNDSMETTTHQIKYFMDKIAKIENPKDNHRIVSRNGMLGRYQFSYTTIKMLGFSHVSKKQFLNNRELQDSVMVTYMRKNDKLLQSLINRYEGREVNGVYVTRAGILAGAHFGGPHRVKRFLETRSQFSDANGMTMKRYMNMFSKVSLPPLGV